MFAKCLGYKLKWRGVTNRYSRIFGRLIFCLEQEIFANVNLLCTTGVDKSVSCWVKIRANRSVLAAASPFFKKVLQYNDCTDIIMKYDDEVYSLVQYAYTGQVDLSLAEPALQLIAGTFQLSRTRTRKQSTNQYELFNIFRATTFSSNSNHSYSNNKINYFS